jgi:hypothetical protein
MSGRRHLLLAEFRDADTLLEAARRARAAGLAGLDAHTPFEVEGLAEALGLRGSRVRVVMLVAGLGMAAFAYWLQWYSAVFDYPLDLGGRPLNSWPVFLIPPFELGVLAAGVAGFVAFLWGSALPRPHHPVFAAHGFERASQDRFFLAVADPAADPDRLRDLLDGLGPLSVQEVPA